MTNSIILSSIALVVSVASFSFSLFQFNRNQSIKKLEKINDTLKVAFELRLKSQDLRNLIDISDDIDSYEKEIESLNSVCENASKVLNNPRTKTSEVYIVEQELLKTTLEFDLLSKQIHEQIRFNIECHEFDSKHKVS
ncbi:hypothetical protein ACOB3W_003561 [Vibrio cholerae]|uniref:hypothetical protein n=1 Tax=Vibrio metoecus TaxID=1481663 RepID=UPI0005107F44|nr:hypothetical protein [Vibrio metoecus]EII3094222.1 hypothetical protein [Vibrio cholerae]EJL6424452.1 hypothetical protein [Vibrio cholerae]HEJ2462815.1 hypothetical protein [Vibrio cholerae]